MALRRRVASSITKAQTAQKHMNKRKEFTQRLRKLFQISSQAEEAEETSPPVEKRLPQAHVGTIVNLLATDAFKMADAGADIH